MRETKKKRKSWRNSKGKFRRGKRETKKRKERRNTLKKSKIVVIRVWLDVREKNRSRRVAIDRHQSSLLFFILFFECPSSNGFETTTCGRFGSFKLLENECRLAG